MKIFCLLLLATALPSWADPLLHYPRHSRDSEPEAYVAELLQLAVERAPLRYRLQPWPNPWPSPAPSRCSNSTARTCR